MINDSSAKVLVGDLQLLLVEREITGICMVNENHLNIALRSNLTTSVMVVRILVTVESFLLQLSDLINLIEPVVYPRTLPVLDETPSSSSKCTQTMQPFPSPTELA